VNYQFAMQMFAVQDSISRFDKEIQLCLKLLPQHRDLVRFKIRLPQSSPQTLESLLEFQKYPSSLQNLAIYQQKASYARLANADLMISGFSKLKSLESLTLSGVALLNTAEVILEKVPSFLNVKKFNVQHAEIHSFGALFDLDKCQTFKNLRYLKVGNIAEMSPLTLLANPPQLESLDIAAAVGMSGPGLISQFISLFSKSLKSLKMDIQYAYEAGTEEKIKTLFRKISELEMLTSFKFKVKNTAPPFAFPKVNLSPEIIEDLKGLFFKPVKLESFEWEVPRISGPGILLDLLKFLEESRRTLRKLKIFHPFMDLEKSQENWIINFLQRLEKIEALYLTGFEIKEEAFWAELVSSLKEMKSLKSLGIGSVTEGFQEEWFTKPLMKLLQIKGLEILNINSAFRPEMEEIVEKPINLKDIMKVNPALKEVSNNIRALFNTAGLEE